MGAVLGGRQHSRQGERRVGVQGHSSARRNDHHALDVLEGGGPEMRVSRLLDSRRRLGPQVSALGLTTATAILVVIAAVTSTRSLSAGQRFPASAAATAATQGRVIGTWRGN